MAKYKTTKKLTKEVISEILKVQKEKGLTAEEVVKVARNKKNPLHDLFEWDNSKAGEQFRLYQARVLVNEVKIIIGENEYSAFENVKVKADNSELKKEYLPMSEILSQDDLKVQVIQSALKQLKYWKRQYAQYKDNSAGLRNVILAIDEFEEEFENGN